MSKNLMNEELLASADPMMDKIRINVYTEGTMKVKSAQPTLCIAFASTERTLTSDWFTNSFIMNVNENF